MVALMISVADNPLFLQFKQANASVLGASRFRGRPYQSGSHLP